MRCHVAWRKFRKLLPVLTTRHLSPRICNKVNEGCVHSFAAKRGDQITQIAMAPPQLPCHDPLDLWHQRQRQNNLSFTTIENWHWGYYIGPLLSNLSQTFQLPALENNKGLGRHGLSVWRLMSINVAWLALTHKIEMHGEAVKMYIDGWMDGWLQSHGWMTLNIWTKVKSHNVWPTLWC